MQQRGNHNTDHYARLEREMLNLTLSSCSVCLGPSHRGFCFKLYNVKKNNNKLLSHLINCIFKELVVYKRLDYSQSTTSAFWSLKNKRVLIPLVFQSHDVHFLHRKKKHNTRTDGQACLYFYVLFIQMRILFAKSLKVFNSFIVVEALSFHLVIVCCCLSPTV